MSDTESRAKTSPSDRRQQEADSGQILAPLDAGKERQAMRIAEPRGRLLAGRLSEHDGRIAGCVPHCPCCQPAIADVVARPLWHIAVSNFEALVLQVWIKSMAGKKPGHERLLY